MPNDLRDVRRAFAWVQAYFREVTKVCERVRLDFQKHAPDYRDLSGQNIEYANSKSFALVDRWLPYWHYQFFAREPEVEQPTLNGLLTVCFEHFEASQPDVEEPLIYLARFVCPEGDPAKRKADIYYYWTETSASTELDSWQPGKLKEMTYSYRVLPLSRIRSLDDVFPEIVQPLLQHEESERTK